MPLLRVDGPQHLHHLLAVELAGSVSRPTGGSTVQPARQSRQVVPGPRRAGHLVLRGRCQRVPGERQGEVSTSAHNMENMWIVDIGVWQHVLIFQSQ